MKNLITFLTVCCLAAILTGCNKGLSGTYKQEESGQIIEFTSSTDFIIRYPDSAVINGTYKKIDGYELFVEEDTVIAFAQKAGKSFVMNDNRYVKQKEKSKISTYLFVIYCIGSLSLYIWVHFWCMKSQHSFREKIGLIMAMVIFWPVGLILLFVFFTVLLFVFFPVLLLAYAYAQGGR